MPKILNTHCIIFIITIEMTLQTLITSIINLVILLVGESKDFQLANSSTATTAAIWDMVLSFIEQSEQYIMKHTQIMNTFNLN